MNTPFNMKTTLVFAATLLFGSTYSAQAADRVNLNSALAGQIGDVVVIDLPTGPAQYRIDEVTLSDVSNANKAYEVWKGYYLHDEFGFDGAIYRAVLVVDKKGVHGAITTPADQFVINGPADNAKIVSMDSKAVQKKVKPVNTLLHEKDVQGVDPEEFYNTYDVEVREAYQADLSKLPELKLGQVFKLKLPEGQVPFVYTGRNVKNKSSVMIPYFEWDATCLSCVDETKLYFYQDGYIGGQIPQQGLYPEDSREVFTDEVSTWIFQATTDEEYDAIGDDTDE